MCWPASGVTLRCQGVDVEEAVLRDADVMGIAEADRHRVAVVRVEIVGEAAEGLRIEFLEVGRGAGGGDRFLGSATDIAGGCRVFLDWLTELATG